MKHKWSENDTYIFVKLFLCHRCLWDTEDENHRSKFHRALAYKDIISKFLALTNIEIDVPYLKKKITSLRSTYCQEVAKVRNRSTSEQTFKPSLKWFAIMHKCLNDRVSLKEEGFRDEGLDIAEDSSQKIWIGTSEEGDTMEDTEGDKDPFTPPEEDNYILLLKSEPTDGSLEQLEATTKKKSKFKHRSSSERSVAGKSIDGVNTSGIERDDEFDIYGKYIASQLRGMNLKRALRVQLQIQRLISEARLQQLPNSD